MIRALLAVLWALGLLLFLFLEPDLGASWITEGYELIVGHLFPSLFLPMVITNFLSAAPCKKPLSRMFHPLCRFLFRTKAQEASAVVFGFLCGYPTGIVLAGDLLRREQISLRDYHRLSLFCNNCGIGFLFSFLGGLFSPQTALCIFFSQLCSCVLLSRLAQRIYPPYDFLSQADPPELSYPKALVRSVQEATKTLCIVGGFVIFFTFLCRWIPRLLPFLGPLSSAIACVLELTNGCMELSRLGLSPLFGAMAVGWGGLCVHAQSSFAAKWAPLSKQYLIFKGINGLSCGIFYILFSSLLL